MYLMGSLFIERCCKRRFIFSKRLVGTQAVAAKRVEEFEVWSLKV
jgi:hypothetical protein